MISDTNPSMEPSNLQSGDYKYDKRTEIVWLLSQEGGVIPVIDMPWKKCWRASWNVGGMCFKARLGTPSRLAALWFGVRRRAFCNIARMICPIIIGTKEVGVGRTSSEPGKQRSRGIVGSGERVVVFIWVSRVITVAGILVKRFIKLIYLNQRVVYVITLHILVVETNTKVGGQYVNEVEDENLVGVINNPND